MTRIFLTLLFFVNFQNSFGQISQTCSCEAIIDVKYKGDILLFKNPKGQESKKLRHNLKEEDFLVLTIKKDSADYFLVDISYAIDDKKSFKGWIAKSDKIGTFAKNYSPGTLKLFSNPDSKSKVKTIVPEWTPLLYTITKCSGNWVFVKISFKGEKFAGWLSPDKQCANPYSTCN
jgi:hypothetical protein